MPSFHNECCKVNFCQKTVAILGISVQLPQHSITSVKYGGGDGYIESSPFYFGLPRIPSYSQAVSLKDAHPLGNFAVLRRADGRTWLNQKGYNHVPP